MTQNRWVAIAILMGCLTFNGAHAEAGNVLPVHGGTAATDSDDLAPLWWQWAFSMPSSLSPISDPTGAHCQVGQGPILSDRVFFLAGGPGNTPIHRQCQIRSTDTLFFPLVNFFTVERTSNTQSCAGMIEQAQYNLSTMHATSITLDGQPVGDTYQVLSRTCFDLLGGRPVAAQDPAGPHRAASAGLWGRLKPLPKGHHVLTFGGVIGAQDFTEEVTYDLDVR